MTKILGLDLGTNSIGWALIDDSDEKIIATGVRIFPEGVENLGQGDREQSKNASRTDARGKRKQFFRKRLRKHLLLKKLSDNGMCPLQKQDFEAWKQNRKFPLTTQMKAWFQLNPYELRAKGVHQELSLMEFGRVLYHLSQRRGFQSNSRSAGDEKEEGVLFDGKTAEGKTGINETIEKMGNHTLGEYLNSVLPAKNKPYLDSSGRVRNRYTTRYMYVDEFEKLWEKQSEYHSKLTHQLKEDFGGRRKDHAYTKDGILFYQRELRSQKHAVGKCTFEPQKTRCPLSAIPFEEMRIYQWLNTVECNDEKLNETEREIILAELQKKEKVTFSSLRKLIKKEGAGYNFNYKDEDKIVGTYTISKLSSKKFFGNSWFKLSAQEQEEIWHTLYFFEDRSKLEEYAIKHWGFDADRAKAISRFTLKDGYASLSRKAINIILPFLKAGYQYDVAVALAGVKNAFGREGWKELSDSAKELIITNVPDIARSTKKGGYISDLHDFLKSEFQLNPKQLKKLYHHSADISSKGQLSEYLPYGKEADNEIMGLKNPVVVTALFELRKVVNEIIQNYGSLDQINIEMARDLKNSKKKRNDMRREQQRLESENDRVITELAALGQNPTHENILTYKLWEECGHICPYTGRKINKTNLYSGEVQIEHIMPWSRSLNDSFMNKTLCFADENRKKGNKTPYEFYSAQGDEKWKEVKARALSVFSNKPHYPNAYQKFKRFVSRQLDDDFISRQLNDTRYISREANNYLKKVCNKVFVSPGQATANLRHYWGLNKILNPGQEFKTRDDHRHHAIDALVMACTKATYLNALSRWNRYDRKFNNQEFPLPWPGFVEEVRGSINSILVSHKKDNRVLTNRRTRIKKNGKVYVNHSSAARGPLHKESVYGKRLAPGAEDETFHIRKPLQSITTKKQCEKIVDGAIKQIIMNRIDVLGGFVKGDKVPDNAFFEANAEGVLVPKIFLKNKNGEPVPVKKVRIKENLGQAERLKDINQYVNPRNNHHVLIYEDQDGELNEEIVTFWTAVQRKRQGLPVVQMPVGAKSIIEILQKNDLFILDSNDLNPQALLRMPIENKFEKLYRLLKITSGTYTFIHHTVSTLKDPKTGKRIQADTYKYDKNYDKFPLVIRKSASSLSAVKVNMNVLGGF